MADPLNLRLPSPLTELHDDRLARAGVRLWLKRDDLISPDFPGNKWRKLALNLAAAQRHGHGRLLTFGGAYSNHLRATAAAGDVFGFGTVGVVRGEEHRPLNPSLAYCAARGMRLIWLDRARYRAKDTPAVLDPLRAEFGPFYLLPEGGSNALAAQGCTVIPAEIATQAPDGPIDVVCCPVGTGGTLAGIAAGLSAGQRALGFAVLRGGFLPAAVAGLQRVAFGAVTGNWEIDEDFHFGGFARRPPELDRFIADFRDRHGVTLDWVYVARMIAGIIARAERGGFAAGTKIAAVITG